MTRALFSDTYAEVATVVVETASRFPIPSELRSHEYVVREQRMHACVSCLQVDSCKRVTRIIFNLLAHKL